MLPPPKQAFHEARDWEKALGWLGEMEAEGVKPNEMTYATAMHVLSQVHWSESVDFDGRLCIYVCKGDACGFAGIYVCRLSVTIQNLPLIYRHPISPPPQPQAGQHREALRLLGRMEAKGIKNVVALTSAMTACEAGRARSGGELGEAMEDMRAGPRARASSALPTARPPAAAPGRARRWAP